MAYWIRPLLLILLPFGLCAQGLRLRQSELERWNAVPFSQSFSIADSISPEAAISQFATADLIMGNTAFGFSQKFFWINILVCNELERDETFHLEVDNPHIDFIQAWMVKDSTINSIGISGDRIPFDARTFDNRRHVFNFSLEERACAELLLLVDKRNAAVTVPALISTEEEFHYRETRQILLYGFYFGMLLLILLYSVLIYVNQRKPTYLWYALYVLFMALYLFVYVGFGFQVLYPWSTTLNNYARLVLIILILVSQIRFTQSFLQLKALSPKLSSWFSALSVVGMLIICWWLIFPGLFTAYTVWVIKMVYVLMGAAVVILILGLAKTHSAQPSSVLFYTAAFSMNVLAFVLVVAEEYGVLELNGWPLSPMFISSFFEIIIFSLGLSYRSRLVSDDRERLLGSIHELKRDAMNSFVEGVEEERKRVASELHDDIASRLSLLKRRAESFNDDKDIAISLAEMTERVRQISHNLHPVALDEESFLEQMRKLVSEHRENGLNVVFQAFDLPAKLPEETGLELYRILQEALQNVKKYADASRVDVQLFHHDGELLLAIEDNGKGFDQDAVKTGMGTRNMRARAERMGGKLEISSAPTKGTSIMVTVPFAEN